MDIDVKQQDKERIINDIKLIYIKKKGDQSGNTENLRRNREKSSKRKNDKKEGGIIHPQNSNRISKFNFQRGDKFLPCSRLEYNIITTNNFIYNLVII